MTAWNYPRPPRVLKILHYEYRVRAMTKAEAEDEGEDKPAPWGFINHYRNEIALDPDLSPATALEVILHEVLHGIWAAMLRYRPKVTEEDATTAMGIGLACVLSQNPLLRRWIDEVSR